jgi:hypothetical protein
LRRSTMARYMVVAHQTATSPELVDRLRDIASRDGAASFTLIVPETAVEHLLLTDEKESREAAFNVANQARAMYSAANLRLERVAVGASSPTAAVDDELRDHPGYDAVVISTLRPGASRWLDMDVHHRIERKTNLPVIHVCEGGDTAWLGRAASQLKDVPIPPPPPTQRRMPVPLLMRDGERASRWPIVFAVMLVYLVATATLALTVNRTFFVTDAIAIGVFAVLIIGVRVAERTRVASE